MQKRREEREKFEERIEEQRNADTGTDTKEERVCLLDISEEGKVLLKDNAGSAGADSAEMKANAVKEPVTYTKTGEAVTADQGASISLSV